MFALLKESGYLEESAELTEEVLRGYLEAHPQAIEPWVIESLDQRSSECWYLLDPKNPEAGGVWVVGFYPGGPRKSYPSGAQACAAFIKRYVERLSGYAKNAS